MDGERLPLTVANKRNRSRQRMHNTSPPSESASLEVVSSALTSPSPSGLHTNQRPDYSTFQNPKLTRESSPPLSKRSSSHFRSVVMSLTSYIFPAKLSSSQIDHNHRVATIAWRAVMIVSAIIALLACLRGNSQDYIFLAEWHWDHNIYIPRNDDAQFSGDDRTSLIAHVVTNRAFKGLADISSRPNRAYARQWGMDYTRYDSGRSTYSKKSCFDKVFVLNAIMDKQSNEAKDHLPLWPHPSRVRYDSIVLLPPDSIVTELDKNMFDLMLPKDKLVAIAGWADGRKLISNSDVILFNMQHRHADAVAKLWLEMAEPKEVTCGANNDLEMLIAAIVIVMDDSEVLDDLIEPLRETRDGFVSDHLMKCIPPSVPGSRAALLLNNLRQSTAILQETADVVCYRFYPKCEVL